MPIAVTPAIEIRGEHMDQPVYLPVTVVGNTPFMTIAKQDRKIERLLLGKTDGSKRSLARTTFIETFKERVGRLFWEQLGRTPKKRMSKADKARIIAIEDEVGVIDAPPVDGHDISELKVLMTKPWDKKKVEATDATIEYLRAVACLDLEKHQPSARSGPKDKFDNHGVRGISMSYSKDCIVAKRRSDGGGKYTTKYIKINGDVDTARALAKDFVEGIEAPADDVQDAVDGSDGADNGSDGCADDARSDIVDGESTTED